MQLNKDVLVRQLSTSEQAHMVHENMRRNSCGLYPIHGQRSDVIWAYESSKKRRPSALESESGGIHLHPAWSHASMCRIDELHKDPRVTMQTIGKQERRPRLGGFVPCRPRVGSFSKVPSLSSTNSTDGALLPLGSSRTLKCDIDL